MKGALIRYCVTCAPYGVKIQNMAIFHLAAQVISRTTGRSATGAAAYRAGERIHDERTGITFDYGRKSGVEYSEIITPSNAPQWAMNRSQLWNAVEQLEKRKDSQVCREIEVALPIELTSDQQRELMLGFIQANFVHYGMIADMAIHRPKQENPHCHILLTMRDISPEGFGQKNRTWNDKKFLETCREQWAVHANRALEQAGHSARIDHRTLESQGIDRIPQIHIGPKVSEMEQRGIQTERGSEILEIEKKNEILQSLKSVIETLQNERNHENPASPQSGTDRRRNRAASLEPSDPSRPSRKQHQSLGEGQPTAGLGMDRTAKTSSEGRRERGRERHSANASPTQSHAEPASNRQRASANAKPALLDDAGSNQLRGHPRSNAIDRIVALAGSATPTPSTGEPRPEGNGRTPQTRTTGSAQKPLDRSYLAARRQLDAMGVASFEVGIRDRHGRMLLRTWTRDETLAAMHWLKRENAKGADVYVRPSTESLQNAGIVLVDDLNRSALARMQADGFNAASVTETSPGNFQAWIRLNDQPIPAELATAAAAELAKRYGGDPNSADWRHFGRLAGLTNQKPIHRDTAGRTPYVLAHDGNGKQPSRAGFQLLGDLAHQLAEKLREVEQENRLKRVREAAVSLQTSQPISDPTQAFKRALNGVLSRFGESVDLSRADYMAAVNMAKHGYSPQDTAKALTEASPELATRKASHQQDYIDRTVRAAYRHPDVVELQQQRQPKPQQNSEKNLER